jgi:hypothetical protein
MEQRDQPPTYFANIVTSNMTTDELTLEFRRFDQPHFVAASLEKSGETVTIIPPPRIEDIFATAPVARITITYAAAKTLKEYLDVVLPRAERARKAGTNIHETP